MRLPPTATLWVQSCACTAGIWESCRGTWRTLLLPLVPLACQWREAIMAFIHHKTNRVWVSDWGLWYLKSAVRGGVSFHFLFFLPVLPHLLSFTVVFFADTRAVPEGIAAPGHRFSEQRQPEYWTKPAHRQRDRADRHRYHRGAGRAEGTAGPHQKQSELWIVILLTYGRRLWCCHRSNPFRVDIVFYIMF